MNRGKKIQVNASSLLDLKAELVRKQEEFKKCKLNNERPIKPLAKKVSPWSKQNKGVANRAKADQVEEKEQEDVLLRSRQALEAKSKLYEQMTNKLIDDETSELYLVDFQRKVIDSVNETKLAKSVDAERYEKEKDEDDNFDAACSDDEWVDYTDTLGRSRRCLRKDLKYLEQVDRTLSHRESTAPKWTNENDLLSEDMKMEIQRQKWEDEEIEKDEEEIINPAPAGPVHYQNVQQQEVRNHGVGYYAFSEDEEERRRQMEELEKLRKQTEINKSHREKIKEKRKLQLQARLAKVQQRKNVVLPPDESEVEVEDEPAKEKEKDLPQQKIVTIEKTTGVRPWDRGKIGVRNDQFNKPTAKKSMSEGQWIENQRKNRDQEFAPPQFYYNDRQKNKWLSQLSFDQIRPGYSSNDSTLNPIENPLYAQSWTPQQTASPPEDISNIPLPEEAPPI